VSSGRSRRRLTDLTENLLDGSEALEDLRDRIRAAVAFEAELVGAVSVPAGVPARPLELRLRP
jgi:hypothetical protein